MIRWHINRAELLSVSVGGVLGGGGILGFSVSRCVFLQSTTLGYLVGYVVHLMAWCVRVRSNAQRAGLISLELSEVNAHDEKVTRREENSHLSVILYIFI